MEFRKKGCLQYRDLKIKQKIKFFIFFKKYPETIDVNVNK